jgi:beta-glucosidase
MERLFSRRKSVAGAAALLLSLAACTNDPSPDPGTPDQPGQPTDAGQPGQPTDAGQPGQPTDAGQPGQPTDAGQPGDAGQPPAPQDAWPVIQSEIPKDPAIEAKIDQLLGEMTIEEKVGQIVQAEINDVTPDQVKKYHLGSVLNGGGSWPNRSRASSVADWYTLADKLWEASMDKANPHQIPIIWGTDAVHGHNNVKGATFFPQNIGLGAARDPDLMRRIGEVTAREVARTGIDWAFAPTIAVVRDDRWGRTYEGFSEDPAVVESYAGKIVEGLQGQLGKDSKTGEKVIATAKHYLGDGGTKKGTDQGITEVTEKQLRDIHGRGYFSALKAGAQTVMASYSSWKDVDKGNNAKDYNMHGNKYLLTDVLKTRMGFDGFVISDWNGMSHVKASNSDSPRDCTDQNCPQAINAGIDMAMIPSSKDWMAFIPNTIAQVKSGEIAPARLDDAVRRILRVKFRMGLFEKPKPSLRVTSHEIGTDENRTVAREAVRKSLVLLKNNDLTLPISRAAKVLVLGKSADSMSNQSGGWSISWQGRDNTNADFGGGTTLWQAIQKRVPGAVLDTSADASKADSSYDVAVVAIGEKPYAEGQGDITDVDTLALSFQLPEDTALLAKLKEKGVKRIVTVLYSGRPLYTNREINQSDAFVAAWLPGSEGDGLTDVLFRKEDGTVNFDFQGKLPYSWPKAPCQTPLNVGDSGYDAQFAYGFGLTYAQPQRTGELSVEERNYGCNASPPGGGTATLPLVLFNAGNQNKYVMRLGAPSNWGGIDVVQSTSNTTSMAPNEISATPVDYVRQWAAIHTVWNGTGQVYMQTEDGKGRDLSGYDNANSALAFEVKVDKGPSSQVNLSVHCEYPCLKEIQLTQKLQDLEGKGWTDLVIPMSCFPKLTFTKVNSPFLLYTDAPMDITLANIRWEASKPGNVSCSGSAPADTIIPLSADRDVYVNGLSDTALFSAPAGWTSGGSGTVLVNAAYDIGGGEQVIDVNMANLKESGGNGGISLTVKAPNYLDASVSASAGVEFEVRVLDYGGTTQDFWAKSVCQRNAGGCATGDLTTLIGRPAVGEWKTVRMPYTNASYGSPTQPWDNTKISSVFEMLPAWGDQAGSIHFQVRNVRLKKQL